MNLSAELTSISPKIVAASSPSFTLNIVGTNFINGSVIYFNNSPLTTTFTDSNNLLTDITSDLISSGGVYLIKVLNPPTDDSSNDGGFSEDLGLQVTISVADAQIKMCDLVNSMRTSLMNGYVTYNEAQFSCSYENTRDLMGINILSLLSGGNLPSGIHWRDVNNNVYNVNSSFAAGFATQLLKFGSACYENSWTHKTNINALTSVNDILSYDYLGGWPDPNIQL